MGPRWTSRASVLVVAALATGHAGGACESDLYCLEDIRTCPAENFGEEVVARAEVGVVDANFDLRLVAAIESSSGHATRSLGAACKGLASDLGVTAPAAGRDGASQVRAWCPAAFDALAAFRASSGATFRFTERRCGLPLAARITCEAECGGAPACLEPEAATRCTDAYEAGGETRCPTDATPTTCALPDDRCLDACVAAARTAARCDATVTVTPAPDTAGLRRVRLLGDVVAALDRLRAVSGAPRDAIAPGIAARAADCGPPTVRRLEVARDDAALAEEMAPLLEAALTGG